MYLDGPRLFILFMVVFYIFYMFFIDKDVFRNFFIATILGIFVYVTYTKSEKSRLVNANQAEFFSNMEKEIQHSEFVFKNIYPLHKPPKNLNYLRKDKRLSKLIYGLRNLRIYDDANYITVIILLEYFLRVHFYVMVGKYDANLYEQLLIDTFTEIVNTLLSMTMNVPDFSTVVIIPGNDIEEYITHNALKIQGILRSHMNVLRKKYGYKKPFPVAFDIRKDHAFSLV